MGVKLLKFLKKERYVLLLLERWDYLRFASFLPKSIAFDSHMHSEANLSIHLQEVIIFWVHWDELVECVWSWFEETPSCVIDWAYKRTTRTKTDALIQLFRINDPCLVLVVQKLLVINRSPVVITSFASTLSAHFHVNPDVPSFKRLRWLGYGCCKSWHSECALSNLLPWRLTNTRCYFVIWRIDYFAHS